MQVGEGLLVHVMMKSSVTRTGSEEPQGASVASPVAGSMRLLEETRTVGVMALGRPLGVIDHSSWGRPSARLYPRSCCFAPAARSWTTRWSPLT